VDHPLLYEINTRCWLRELAERQGRPIRLGDVPDAEVDRWQQLGFTHIWLMGVWTTGPRSRAHSLSDPSLRAAYDECLPGWKKEDVAGSPYAIADYTVPRALGGETGLKKFRRRLHARGLKLILDFVPNHVGLDHDWLAGLPKLFVQTTAEAPGTFRRETADGARWLAHGKDPHFLAWADTVQLDYRNPETRRALLEALESVASRCDGVRCDMAMLVLNDVFARTWEDFPSPTPPPPTEFWADALATVKRSHPHCLFLAEAYWDLEARLQSLGFDYTYDKRLYDYVVRRNHREVQDHLLSVPPEFVEASAHFLENHDEPRIASLLSLAEHRAAALLTLGLPGMRFLHDGQLTGARLHTRVHLTRRVLEPSQPEIAALYEYVLRALQISAVGRGQGEVLHPRAAWPDNPTHHYFVIVQWHARPDEFDLVAVNLALHRSQCYAPLTVPDLANYNWRMKDLLGHEEHVRNGDDLQTQGLYLDLPDHGAQLFHFQPVA